MISVACYIKFPVGSPVDSFAIDEHRGVCVFSGDTGVRIRAVNGQTEKNLILSYEAATALYHCMDVALARHYAEESR